jgi:tetratricopeptide (TPR) repeat protein
MALKPEDRYPTARALAAEVERWLADEPVSAWREPRRLRLGRWARRHQKAVAATVAGLLVAMLAGVAGGWWLLKEKDKTEQALNRSQRAEKSASAQRQLALKTVRRVVDRIHARLKGSPNQQELRKDLLNEALEGLQEVDRAADTAEADHATIRALVELGDIFRDIEVGGLAEARKLYERAKELARGLAGADPRSAQAQSDLSLALTRVGDVLLRQGETKAALDSYKEGLGISRQLAEADRGSALAQRELAVALIKLGDVQLQQGETKAALDSYQESLGVFRQLAAADRRSTLARRDLALCLERVGDVQLRQGKTKETLDTYQESLGIRRELAEADRNLPQAQRDLSLALERVGDVQLRQGGPKAALTFYQESLGVRRKLARADRHSALAQRDLAVALNKLGGVQLEQEDTKGALASYQESLGVSRQLAEADRGSAEAQRDLAIALGQMGDLHLRQRQTKAALQFCQDALGVFRQLAEADRGSAEAQRDLALALDRVGDGQWEQKETKGALASYQESLGLWRQLAADRLSAQAQRDLLLSYAKLGNLAQESADFPTAVDWYSRAREVGKAFSRPAVFQQEVAELDSLLAFCRFAARHGIEDLTAIDKQPADQQFPLLSAVQRALVRRKDHARAVQAAEKLAGLAKEKGEVFDAACAFALCVPLADKEKARDELGVKAMALLRQAAAKGYTDAAPMMNNTDLDALRQRDDFQKLVAELEKAQPK